MSETNYGVIADRLAWEVPLNPTATIELPPFQVFTTAAPEESEHALRVRPQRQRRFRHSRDVFEGELLDQLVGVQPAVAGRVAAPAAGSLPSG